MTPFSLLEVVSEHTRRRHSSRALPWEPQVSSAMLLANSGDFARSMLICTAVGQDSVPWFQMFYFPSVYCTHTHSKCQVDVFRPFLPLQRNSCTFKKRRAIELSGSWREPRVMAVSSPGRMITIQLTEMRFGVYKGWWGNGLFSLLCSIVPSTTSVPLAAQLYKWALFAHPPSRQCAAATDIDSSGPSDRVCLHSLPTHLLTDWPIGHPKIFLKLSSNGTACWELFRFISILKVYYQLCISLSPLNGKLLVCTLAFLHHAV